LLLLLLLLVVVAWLMVDLEEYQRNGLDLFAVCGIDLSGARRSARFCKKKAVLPV
jgi:hypothetical protein